MSPLQASKGFKIVALKPWGHALNGASIIRNYRLAEPFRCSSQPLPGTAYRYQLAVSSSSRARDINPVRCEQSELEESGDQRSGVVVLDGSKVVASFIYPGYRFEDEVRVAVHPNYRREGLAKAMTMVWFQHTKRRRSVSPQTYNTLSARLFIRCHVEISRWAVEQGKDVPAHVLEQLETGEEEQYLRGLLDEVERTKEPVWV